LKLRVLIVYRDELVVSVNSVVVGITGSGKSTAGETEEIILVLNTGIRGAVDAEASAGYIITDDGKGVDTGGDEETATGDRSDCCPLTSRLKDWMRQSYPAVPC
jgi:hypothetical protein